MAIEHPRTHYSRRQHLLGMTLLGCEDSRREPELSRVPPERGAAPRTSGSDTPRPQNGAGSAIPRRPLGSTGREVSAIGIGGHHLGIPSEAEAIRIMHHAIDHGVTFFDNCWDYHDGESERRMGKGLRGGKRQHVFLMTKLDGRTERAAELQLEDSLQRLQVDHIDLVQVHEVIREKDPSWVFGEGGAIETLKKAQRAGKIGFIGFTGHKSPEIHLKMLEVADAHGFRFDAVQMPLNVMDPHFESFETRVLPLLVKQQIGVLGMKPLGAGEIVKSGQATAEECLRYALSLPTSVVITGCDSLRVLSQAIEVARSFEPMMTTEKQALLARTQNDGRSGKLEGFKTTDQYDATARNPHWLTGGEI